MRANEMIVGGSFGVVYKAIERSTGEVVAIKHVSKRSISGSQLELRAESRIDRFRVQ